MPENTTPSSMSSLAAGIKQWGMALGFQQVGITDVDLSAYEPKFHAWLAAQFHGDMHYMEKHGSKRTKPAELVPGTIRIISVRMDYFPEDSDAMGVLKNPSLAYVSRYALGRDYHKVLRQKLTKLGERIHTQIHDTQYRVFTDSAPVLEKPIAEKAGLGWIGKHTNLINSKAGSYFFLGELFTNLPLPIDPPQHTSHCGSCTTCITVCPTAAIVAPYQLDARRCISYLTIELHGSIPLEFRKMIGNRVYGCDDCQLFCPWNKFAKSTQEDDFKPRHDLATATLIDLFTWDEATFLKKTEGSAIRRIGHERWLRNIAVALGNAPKSEAVIQALQSRLNHTSLLVQEHVKWGLSQFQEM